MKHKDLLQYLCILIIMALVVLLLSGTALYLFDKGEYFVWVG
jgi:hypothetical protein